MFSPLHESRSQPDGAPRAHCDLRAASPEVAGAAAAAVSPLEWWSVCTGRQVEPLQARQLHGTGNTARTLG